MIIMLWQQLRQLYRIHPLRCQRPNRDDLLCSRRLRRKSFELIQLRLQLLIQVNRHLPIQSYPSVVAKLQLQTQYS